MHAKLKSISRSELLAAALVTLSFCQSCQEDMSEKTVQTTDDVLCFSVGTDNGRGGVDTRATLYSKEDDLLDVTKGGGNFTVSAYLTGTETPYLKDARVWYFADPQVSDWIFLDESNKPKTYYWTNSNLNFFAYMPNAQYDGKDGYQSKETYVRLGSYSDESGQTFTCALPENVGPDTQMQEFIYAYVTNLSKKTERVPLHFRHPFALINFKVGVDSYRMTIKDIQLDGIYLDGRYTTASAQWEPTADRKTYTMGLNQRIPNDINYNTLLFDWFLVMPQSSASEVKLTLDFTRNSESDETESISVNLPVNWEQGKKYIYTIKIGENKEEIYFNVLVDEDWIENGETNIDVE